MRNIREFEEEYRDKDNIKAVNNASRGFSRFMSNHDFKSLKDEFFWRAYRKYDDRRSNNFQKFLFFYIRNCFLSYCYKQKKKIEKRNFHKNNILEKISVRDFQDDRLVYSRIDEVLECLEPEEEKIVRDYYLNNINFTEMSRENGKTSEYYRLKLLKVLEKLKRENRNDCRTN